MQFSYKRMQDLIRSLSNYNAEWLQCFYIAINVGKIYQKNCKMVAECFVHGKVAKALETLRKAGSITINC